MNISPSKMVLKKENSLWLEQYLRNCRHQNKSELTLKNYRSDCQKFLTWYELMQKKPLKKINAEDISAYRKFLLNGGKVYFNRPPIQNIFWKIRSYFSKNKQQNLKIAYLQNPLKIASAKRHMSSVKNLMEYLKQTHEERKLFLINPVKSKIHQIKLKDKDIDHTKMLTKDEWKKVQEACWSGEEKLLTGLLYYGGFRLDEVRTLKYENFNLQEGSVQLIRKGGRLHHLKLKNADYLMQLIKKHREMRKDQSDYLFTSKRKAAYGHKALYNKIMKIFSNAGVSRRLGPHSFRKACATNLYLKHKDLLLVRDYLNHRDAKVTQTYIDKDVLAKDAQKRL